MKKLLALLTLALAVQAAPLVAATSGMDDSVWNATFSDKSKDTLVFAKGQFVSTKCVPYGYGVSPYSPSAENPSQWKAEQMSGQDKTSWTGSMNGKTMKGTFVYMPAHGKTETKEWTATKE